MAPLRDRTGWVPVRFAQAAGGAFVEWCWFGSRRFTEPFFDQTASAAMSTPFNTVFAHWTPMAELGEWRAKSPGIRPAGFIFHMSRCGSTLLAQMLAAVPGHVAISEAAPLDRLARAPGMDQDTRSMWLRWMVSALGQARGGGETRCFVKFDSATTAAIPAIRAAFPDVPWVFLYRDPEEVMVSHMRRPSPAMMPGMITDTADPLAGVEVSPEEYAARSLGDVCKDAIESYGRGGGLLVNYAELPGAVTDSIARHLGIAWTARERELMNAAAAVDTKVPGRAFRSDSEEKRREVSEAVRAAASEWIEPCYSELERLRRMKRRNSSPPAGSKPRRE